MLKRIIFLVVLVFSLMASPDIFGPVPQKRSQKRVEKKTSSLGGASLIGVVFSSTQKYAFFMVKGRYLILKEGQGKKFKLEKVINSRSVVVRYRGRKKLMQIHVSKKGGKK